MATQAFGKYQLVKKLATGGMAEVWLALQTGIEGFNRHVVLKRILPHLAEDPEFVQMFLNEAKIASRFNHPNIAQIYDLGAELGTYYIAMEYVHGEDLGRVMRRAWTSQQWVARHIAMRIIADACQGLHYAHTRSNDQGQPLRVVHRDISPQNLIISFDGAVKIVDFGIAKAADQVSLTQSGAIKGKFAYMAPEQAGGKPLDARSDIYALGLVLYELITGVRPLKRESELATLQAALEGAIELPSVVAEVPAELDHVVMGALAKNPADRYRDAREFQKAIEQYLLDQKEMATSLQVSELMETLFADRLSEEKRSGVPSPSTESSTNNVAAAYPEAAEAAPVERLPAPRPTPAAPPAPSSTLNDDDDDEASFTDPELDPDRRLPQGAVGPTRAYATPKPSARPPEPVRRQTMSLAAPDPRRRPRPSVEVPRASDDDEGTQTAGNQRRPSSTTNRRRHTASAMPEAPARRSRVDLDVEDERPRTDATDDHIVKLVNVEEMKSRAGSRLMGLVALLLLASVAVLAVFFKDQLLALVPKGALSSAVEAPSGGVRFSVTTNPPTQVFLVPPEASGRARTALGSTPLTDASGAVGDTVLLVNDDRGIYWEEVLSARGGSAPRMIDKSFKEVMLNVTTTPKLKNATIWRGGLKLALVGVRFAVFPGVQHLEIRSEQLKAPFQVDVTVAEGQGTEKKVDVSAAVLAP